jgi:Ku protein
MASPRSMWSGSIQLGLLNVPITVGKSWTEEREKSLVQLCADHKVPIDRTERCGAGHETCSLVKVRGVQVSEGEYKALDAAQYAHIEDSTKSDMLTILDAQPVYELPLEYGTGTYFLRPDKKVKGSVTPFAVLVKAMRKSDYGLIVKWCRSARQQLAVIHVNVDGLLVLTTIPYVNELRTAGDQERAHMEVEPDDAHVDLLVDLLEATSNEEGFQHDAYKDDGLVMRARAVNEILSGKTEEKKPEPVQNVGQDIMAALKASIAQKK